MAYGKCKLTGHEGKLVASHLIPRAFTRPEQPGLPFLQSGSGKRVIRRWDSWYDRELVTRRGEDVLERYDTWAVAFLRRQLLVWSGWDHDAVDLGERHKTIEGSPWGVRVVEVEQPELLRLFFLSLLWRAAASGLVEFSEVAVPPPHLETLRELVSSGNVGRPDFYPVSLTQLSTRGRVHNMAPIVQLIRQPKFESVTAREIPTFRFYFDGLVAHVARQDCDEGWAASMGPLVVGNEHNLTVSTVTYETSFQKENLGFVLQEAIWD